LTPHLETKGIATKREKKRPGHSSIIMQNFTLIGGTVAKIYAPDKIRSLAVAERPRDISCLSVVSYNGTTSRARSSIIGHFGFMFTAAYN